MDTLFDLNPSSPSSSSSGRDSHVSSAFVQKNQPLAARMRPQSLDEFVGQEQAVGTHSWLRRAIEHDILSSLILYGPSGTGKTTLAHIIAAHTKASFIELSALTAGVKDVRSELERARSRLYTQNRRTILFIDEIHRFSRAQQDSLLQAVENRDVILIGATTENPCFEVNTALISRSRVIELVRLDDEAITRIVRAALLSPRGLDGAFELEDSALALVVALSQGDARRALTSLELSAQMACPTEYLSSLKDAPSVIAITEAHVEEACANQGLVYDKDQDMHYDIVSAFIKSMRGSAPDAALYWLARMLDAGEDPLFCARRILICASEDIGNADPQAICVASAAFHAAQTIGMPEVRINLAQAALYCALAPKSNACEKGIDRALKEVRSGVFREVPSYLRDRHNLFAKNFGSYHYPHNYASGWVDQSYLPKGLKEGAFFESSPRGWEAWASSQLDAIKMNARKASHD